MAFKNVRNKFYPRLGNFENVFDGDRLMSINHSQCGRIIKLENLPRYCFGKLLLVLENSQLERILLAKCFTNPLNTLEVLTAIQRNDKLQKIHLDMQDNGYNESCLRLVIDFISKRVVKSFEVFYSMTEEHTELLLENIVRYDAKLKIFNLSGAILNDKSLEYLEKLLQKGKISEILRLSKCKGIAGASLTNKDKIQLEKASKSGNRFFQRNIKIYWFDYVGYLDVDRHNSDRLKFLKIDGVSFNKETGKNEKLVRYLVKDVADQIWQVFKPGSKRKSQQIFDINKKQKKPLAAADEQDLSELFESSVNVKEKKKRFAKKVSRGRRRKYHSSESSGDEYRRYQQNPGGQNPFERQRYGEQPSWYNKAVPDGDPGEGGSTTQEKSYYYQRQQSPNVSAYSPTHSATQPTSFASQEQYNQSFSDIYGSPIATANPGTSSVNPTRQLQPEDSIHQENWQNVPHNQRLPSFTQRDRPPCRDSNQHRVQPGWSLPPQQQVMQLPPRYQRPHQGNPTSGSATILQSGPPIQSTIELSRIPLPSQSAAQSQQSRHLRPSTSSTSAAGIQIFQHFHYSVQAGSQIPGNANSTFSQLHDQTYNANQQSPECNNPHYRGHPQHDTTAVYAHPSADNENDR